MLRFEIKDEGGTIHIKIHQVLLCVYNLLCLQPSFTLCLKPFYDRRFLDSLTFCALDGIFHLRHVDVGFCVVMLVVLHAQEVFAINFLNNYSFEFSCEIVGCERPREGCIRKRWILLAYMYLVFTFLYH